MSPSGYMLGTVGEDSMDVDRAASPTRSEYERSDDDADHDEAAARRLKEGDGPTTIELIRKKILGAVRPEVTEEVLTPFVAVRSGRIGSRGACETTLFRGGPCCRIDAAS